MDYSHDQLIPEHPGITNVNYYDNNMYYPYPDCFSPPDNAPTIAAVATRRIQQFTALHADKHATLSIDSGCEGNCILFTECKRLGIPVRPLDYDDVTPTQADGITNMEVVGKVSCNFERNSLKLHFEGYSVKQLARNILCGLPFIERNEIIQLPASRKLIVSNKTIMEDPPLSPVSQLPFSVQVVPHTQGRGTHTHRTHSGFESGAPQHLPKYRGGAQ